MSAFTRPLFEMANVANVVPGAMEELSEPDEPRRELERARRKPRLGTARGTVKLKPGWDAPLTDEALAEWYAPVGGLDEP